MIMSPKTHPTLALTVLIAGLNCHCSGVRCNPLNDVEVVASMGILGHQRCIKDCLRKSESKAVAGNKLESAKIPLS